MFRISPVPYPVLVCTDELSGHTWRIDQDPDWKPEIEHTLMAVVGQLSRYGIGGDRRQPSPLPPDEKHGGWTAFVLSGVWGPVLRQAIGGGLRASFGRCTSWRLLVA